MMVAGDYSCSRSVCEKQPQRVLAIPSLGQLRHLSAVKHAAAVMGNSSSGIIEVPSLKYQRLILAKDSVGA